MSQQREIHLTIFDVISGDRIELPIPPIGISVNAMYNEYRVTPPRGLNFGPVKMGEKKDRSFELSNIGIFDFDWYLFDPDNPPESGAAPPANLKIGPFTIQPAGSKLQPTENMKIDVTFDAQDDAEHECKLGLYVEGVQGAVDLTDTLMSSMGGTSLTDRVGSPVSASSSSAEKYVLSGQSCIPGIDKTNIQTIFEEQFVAGSLEDAVAVAGRVEIPIFCEMDNCFSFGPVVAQNRANEESKGVTETFRISNPNAIPCTVEFKINNRGAPAAAGGKGAPAAEAVFTLDKETLDIPPFEYRPIMVTFNPPRLEMFTADRKSVV